MNWLLDTDVLSMAAPQRSAPDNRLIEWLDAHAEALLLSVVTIWELEAGCEALQLRGATAKAQALRNWIDGVEGRFAPRLLPIDPAVAALGGRKLARANARGHDPKIGDALIAAQAEIHALTVVTRNRRHFAALDAPVFDPVEG